MDLSKITNIKIEDIDRTDHPDYCDAYIVSASYKGKELSEEQIDLLNENKEFVQEAILNHLQ